MNILVLGASQGTGALAVQAALSRGHSVTAFARSPQKLQIEHPQLRKLVGDFHDAASVAAAVPGHDAVVITASATRLSAFKTEPHYFSKGTAHAITAMQANGVKRLVVLSALGTGNSLNLLPWIMRKVAVGWLLKVPFADHEVQEQQVMASGLEWVIARPSGLTNGPARGKYVAAAELRKVPSMVARADVADFLVKATESDAWLRQAVQLGG